MGPIFHFKNRFILVNITILVMKYALLCFFIQYVPSCLFRELSRQDILLLLSKNRVQKSLPNICTIFECTWHIILFPLSWPGKNISCNSLLWRYPDGRIWAAHIFIPVQDGKFAPLGIFSISKANPFIMEHIEHIIETFNKVCVHGKHEILWILVNGCFVQCICEQTLSHRILDNNF